MKKIESLIENYEAIKNELAIAVLEELKAFDGKYIPNDFYQLGAYVNASYIDRLGENEQDDIIGIIGDKFIIADAYFIDDLIDEDLSTDNLKNLNLDDQLELLELLKKYENDLLDVIRKGDTQPK